MNGAKYIGLGCTPGNDLRRRSGFCLQVGQAHPAKRGASTSAVPFTEEPSCFMW